MGFNVTVLVLNKTKYAICVAAFTFKTLLVEAGPVAGEFQPKEATDTPL